MKERITVTLDKGLLDWLDARIKEKKFANRSHGLEYLMKKKYDEDRQSAKEKKKEKR